MAIAVLAIVALSHALPWNTESTKVESQLRLSPTASWSFHHIGHSLAGASSRFLVGLGQRVPEPHPSAWQCALPAYVLLPHIHPSNPPSIWSFSSTSNAVAGSGGGRAHNKQMSSAAGWDWWQWAPLEDMGLGSCPTSGVRPCSLDLP